MTSEEFEKWTKEQSLLESQGKPNFFTKYCGICNKVLSQAEHLEAKEYNMYFEDSTCHSDCFYQKLFESTIK